jgi:hypothetical protein
MAFCRQQQHVAHSVHRIPSISGAPHSSSSTLKHWFLFFFFFFFLFFSFLSCFKFILLFLVVEKIRESPKSNGLVYANGMYVTKHAIGVYGKGRPKFKWAENFSKFADIQESIYRAELPPLVFKGEGPFKVEAFMVNHNKQTGKPLYGILLGTLVNTGERTLANFAASPAEMERMEKIELVGMIGTCIHDEATRKNKVSFSLAKL